MPPNNAEQPRTTRSRAAPGGGAQRPSSRRLDVSGRSWTASDGAGRPRGGDAGRRLRRWCCRGCNTGSRPSSWGPGLRGGEGPRRRTACCCPGARGDGRGLGGRPSGEGVLRGSQHHPAAPPAAGRSSPVGRRLPSVQGARGDGLRPYGVCRVTPADVEKCRSPGGHHGVTPSRPDGVLRAPFLDAVGQNWTVLDAGGRLPPQPRRAARGRGAAGPAELGEAGAGAAGGVAGATARRGQVVGRRGGAAEVPQLQDDGQAPVVVLPGTGNTTAAGAAYRRGIVAGLATPDAGQPQGDERMAPARVRPPVTRRGGRGAEGRVPANNAEQR